MKPPSLVCFLALLNSVACNQSPRIVTPSETTPGTPSRSSERIVFVSDRATSPFRQIYLMNKDGSGQTRVTHDSIDYVSPMIAPNGSSILATSYTEDNSDDLYSIALDGSRAVNLTHSPGDDNCPSFSPDGSRIVFVSTRDGNSEIYIMDADGRNQMRLTFNELTDHAPQFFPDGSRILFCSTKVDPLGTYSYDTDLYSMNIDGSNKMRLTAEGSYHFYGPHLGRSSLARELNLTPSISSNGQHIVFSSYDIKLDNNWALVMDADGKNCRVVYAGDFIVAPVFAPGDSMIVFLSHRDGKYDLYEMALNGQKQKKLTEGTPGHVLFPQFSPDGSKILFSTDVGSYMTGSFQTIWMMNRNGSGQVQLSSGRSNDWFPRFEPISATRSDL
jgi:Tol biopolymer transport system component